MRVGEISGGFTLFLDNSNKKETTQGQDSKLCYRTSRKAAFFLEGEEEGGGGSSGGSVHHSRRPDREKEGGLFFWQAETNPEYPF